VNDRAQLFSDMDMLARFLTGQKRPVLTRIVKTAKTVIQRQDGLFEECVRLREENERLKSTPPPSASPKLKEGTKL
jgi:hypothetical protein